MDQSDLKCKLFNLYQFYKYNYKTHGFPNLLGVVTHLDDFKNDKKFKKTKKSMKKRF